MRKQGMAKGSLARLTYQATQDMYLQRMTSSE